MNRAGVLVSIAMIAATTARGDAARKTETWVIREGVITLWLDPGLMQYAGLRLESADSASSADVPSDAWTLDLPAEPGSRVELEVRGRGWALAGGDIRFRGGVTMRGDRSEEPLDEAVVAMQREGAFERIVVGTPTSADAAFCLRDADVRIDPASGVMVITTDELTLSREWATRLGRPTLADAPIGLAVVRAALDRRVDGRPDDVSPGPSVVEPLDTGSGSTAGGIGPDVIVYALQSAGNYGSEFVAERGEYISAFSVGTSSCNIGDANVQWSPATTRHPVISQSMFRLKDDRFEEIGASWLKHGYFSVNTDRCGDCIDPDNGYLLGVGCSDPYTAALNGTQISLSPRSDVNAFTGEFPPRCSDCPYDGLLARRLQVRNADLDPNLNAGAEYFVEGHYVTADDAQAGNGENNASYRAVDIRNTAENVYGAFPTGPTMETSPAIRAWQGTDPDVVEVDARVPSEGLFIVAAKSRDLENGFWRYEYAVHNLNSDRSAGSFRVPLPEQAIVQNIGFHDVDYHSGEVYDGTDWPAVVGADAITWSTTHYGSDPNANALRWGTLYNFRFEISAGPAPTTITLGLFKPGVPSSIDATTIGPVTAALDCNSNGIADLCDVDCEQEGCGSSCGTSADCNGNRLPDDCEPDCNESGVADECEIATGARDDCDGNGIPDDCDPDCDGDGTPDACELIVDTDEDGVVDCEDECPDTSPPGSCACPPTGLCCCPSGLCLADWSTQSCLDLGCTPECVTSPCRNGCLIGDSDGDGDLDFYDAGMMGRCFSGGVNTSAYLQPDLECLRRFDFDNDLDVDLVDYGRFRAGYTGPTAP